MMISTAAYSNFLSDTMKTSEGKKALSKFVVVTDFIAKEYVKEYKNEELLERMTKLLIEDLDPHSSYMNEKEYKKMKEMSDGNFTGVGMVVEKRDGYVKVVSPIDDTPADIAGIKTGDRIIKIDGIRIGKKTLEESVKMMRGVPGTSVELTIKRKNKTLVKEIVRDIITIKSVKHEIFEGVGYIRISSFNKNTTTLAEEALNAFEDSGIENIILDLRNNPGGLLSSAIEVSDLFMNNGKLIVYTKGRGNSREYYAESDRHSNIENVAVLINSGSASASEIVAGALQDTELAIIVGEKSFGKGSVQTMVPMSDGTAIKMTTSLYYTPLGRSIQAKGINPDINISERNKSEDDEDMGESNLDGRIDNPNEGKADKDEDNKLVNKLSNDNYVARAIKYFDRKKILTLALQKLRNGQDYDVVINELEDNLIGK